jgi:PAS domain S-box-containing protein
LREAKVRAARAEAEQQMRESELRYRLLWETCPDAVLLMDANGYIQFANPAVESVFAYKPVELLGRNVTLLQPPELREANPLAFVEYVRSGRRQTGWAAREAIGLRKDGRRVIIEISASEMVLQGQRRYVGFIRDITERKKAEEALRAHEQEMQVAREIQRLLFPASAPQVPGFEISGASFPADAACGDYFDYLPMPAGRLGLVVADITGHGVGPALLMAETRAYLRLLTRNREKVEEILSLANRTLVEDVGNERFVTLMLAQLDPEARTLVYGSAGHPAGYVVDASGEVKATLRSTGPPLGIASSANFRASSPVPLVPGDVLLLLTDGIEETTAPDKTLYEARRALEFLRQNRSRPAAEIVRGLYDSVREFAQGHPLTDDITALVVKVL